MDELDLDFTEAQESDDSFAQLIVLMRIYDVLMADLTIKDASKAQALLEAHAKGIIVGPVPAYNGVHLVKENTGDLAEQGEIDNSSADASE